MPHCKHHSSRVERRIGTLWPILAFASACSAKITDAGSGASAAGESGGGAAGQIALRVASVEKSGSTLTVNLSGTENLYDVWCGELIGAPDRLQELRKADGTRFRDDAPSCGTREPYFLDGTYRANEPVGFGYSCGCDTGGCESYSPHVSFGTAEYIQVGTAPPPNVGGAGNGGSGGVGGAVEIPVIETRSTTGPYQLTLGYFLDPACSADVHWLPPVLVDAP